MNNIVVVCHVAIIIIQFRSSTFNEIRVILFDIVPAANVKATAKHMTNAKDNTGVLPAFPRRRTLLKHCVSSLHTGQLLPVQ